MCGHKMYFKLSICICVLHFCYCNLAILGPLGPALAAPARGPFHPFVDPLWLITTPNQKPDLTPFGAQIILFCGLGANSGPTSLGAGLCVARARFVLVDGPLPIY